MGTIKKIYVSCKGDPSVGIPGCSASINAGGDFLIDLDTISEDDQQRHLGFLRKKVCRVFEWLWGEPITVMFDFELDQMIKQEDELYEHDND